MNPPFRYLNGELHGEGVALRAVAERFGTPTYVYSRNAIDSAYQAFVSAFGSRAHLVCYAVKANGNLALLQLLARLGAGFDIVSGGELARVLRAGGAPARIVFSGVGKTRSEIAAGLEAGIRCFNVESVSELRRIAQVARGMGVTAPVALRVNPNVDAETHPYIATGLAQHKFGIPIDQVPQLVEDILASTAVRLSGLACHIGSQITEMAPFRDSARIVVDLAQSLRNQGFDLDHIDFGGGLGIAANGNPAPVIADYVETLCRICDEPDWEIVIEPGRAIVGEAGALLTRVELLKESGDKGFAVVNAGMNDFLRPALYGALHDVLPIAAGSVGEGHVWDIVGPVCESADVLASGRGLALAEGDLLAIMQAGAYGAVMSSHYNGRPRAAEVLLDGAEMHLVRRRETVEDMLQTETLLTG